ncbi:Inner membrane protein yrbG [Acholeplasma oculi]|uniref:K+-dependent Na+/Ca+ exchanger n=1 Tax=Acholeplasma oculi TaxID=35623 RepID=A0A061A8Y9_9MOLU|nr:calcium/sodium antiporter [Acholeplasma oculi]CDR30308.1 K+-dependent Na+/Ca+ exchanger [Acholeplasma oculi]SKC43109.1 cation:H+ antiporter [Acholeplasma oculi]SUT88769.1 Inner membrane protein yrbG [Acholeplasma oculi]
MLDIGLVLLGFLIMVKGADFFVEGSAGIAKKLKVPTLIIGLTIVAFGTSMPEAAISITASIQQNHSMSLGNIVGSNLFNTLLILGLSAMISPVIVKNSLIKREIPISLIASLLLLGFFFINGDLIDRLEGFIFLLFFGYFVYKMIKDSKDQDIEEIPTKFSLKINILLTIVGLAMIVLGGVITTDSAVKVALSFGMSPLLVGLTILAVGTSLPELVTSVVAAYKKESDIAIGNIVGSNIFNILFVYGASQSISPAPNPSNSWIDLSILAGVTILTWIFSKTGKKIGRFEGFILFAIYIGYMVYIIIRN